VSHQDTLRRRGVAHVEVDRCLTTAASEPGREHLESAFNRLPADLGAEIAGPTVTSSFTDDRDRPSFTSSRAIEAPKTPRAIGTPSASRSAQKRSWTGSASSGGAADEKPGRLPLPVSSWRPT
jgi:hypothetical protein